LGYEGLTNNFLCISALFTKKSLLNKIPVHIITGFLGSGKTTAILNFLDKKTTNEQWAIIINEFGKISIDSHTIASSAAGKVFDISGGCICCSAKEYFQENIENIVRSGNYDRIIIEPSGLGGVDMIVETVKANPTLELLPLVCLVDLTSIENPRLNMNLIFQSQIRKADIIVFSKCDLLPDITMQQSLVTKFKSKYPDKQFCLNLWSSFLETKNPVNTKRKKYRIDFLGDMRLKDSNYHEYSFTFNSDIIFDLNKLTCFFSNSAFIIRSKGYLHTNEGWKLINFTLSGYSFENCKPMDRNELVLITEQSELNTHIGREIEKLSYKSPIY
jgi:G3E family GTPase